MSARDQGIGSKRKQNVTFGLTRLLWEIIAIRENRALNVSSEIVLSLTFKGAFIGMLANALGFSFFRM